MAKELKQEGLQSVIPMILLNEIEVAETMCSFLKSRLICCISKHRVEEYLNDFFEKREQVRKSLEKAHEYIVSVVEDGIIDDKEEIGRALANLFSMSEIIRETYVSPDYNVSFDIFHTMKRLGVEHIDSDDLELIRA